MVCNLKRHDLPGSSEERFDLQALQEREGFPISKGSLIWQKRAFMRTSCQQPRPDKFRLKIKVHVFNCESN